MSIVDFSRVELAMQGEEDELLPTMPVLPRLDRLDRLLQYLEERRNSSDAHYSCSFPINTGVDKQCKPLSSVLEEVHFKGTVMERVAMLENRVLQLSLEMEEGSTSSSSTIPTSEKIRNVLIKRTMGKFLTLFTKNKTTTRFRRNPLKKPRCISLQIARKAAGTKELSCYRVLENV